MFNAHPDGFTTEQLMEYLTHVYKDDAYVVALCERIVDWEEVEAELRSEIGYLTEQLADLEGQDD